MVALSGNISSEKNHVKWKSPHGIYYRSIIFLIVLWVVCVLLPTNLLSALLFFVALFIYILYEFIILAEYCYCYKDFKKPLNIEDTLPKLVKVFETAEEQSFILKKTLFGTYAIRNPKSKEIVAKLVPRNEWVRIFLDKSARSRIDDIERIFLE